MSTQPVFKCKRCGKPFVVSGLRTRGPDPDGTLLFELMKGLPNLPCPECQRKQQYYTDIGRADDWAKGRA